MNRIIRISAFIMLFGILLASCEDEASSSYSNKNYVYCFFNTLQYTQLHNAMGNPGQFVSVRKRTSNGKTVIEMSNSIGTEQYTVDAISTHFSYGLGGIIVGTNYYGENLAYDLSCPNCDRADHRLTLRDDGTAKCAKCGIVYDLNNLGIISAVEGEGYQNPRGLYRYRITYDGTNVSVYN